MALPLSPLGAIGPIAVLPDISVRVGGEGGGAALLAALILGGHAKFMSANPPHLNVLKRAIMQNMARLAHLLSHRRMPIKFAHRRNRAAVAAISPIADTTGLFLTRLPFLTRFNFR